MKDIDKTNNKKCKFFCSSKERKYIVNLIICLLCFVSLLLVPSLIAIMLEKHVDTFIGGLIGDAVLIIIIILVYLKDLIEEAKIYFRSFKSNFKYSFKIYLLGFMGMLYCSVTIQTATAHIRVTK